ncbi:MAG: T9SS type A sorting domain-containing protein [Bacteroidetes bacterium]|nr:T9SS type A sorting domain-containing protein [Bacteroidota bacterium]
MASFSETSNLNKATLKIAPNPFKTNTVIAVKSESETFSKVEILNILGKKVRTLVLENDIAVLNKENLYSGIYFVKCVGNKESILIGKVIIE